MKAKAKTNLDDFNYWVADMDDALDRFMDLLPSTLQSQLDYTAGSLNVLEAWLLSRYPSTQAMLAASESKVVDGIARYVGETFRKNAGGQWNIELDNPKALYFATPILSGYRIPLSPLALSTTAADRRTGNFLESVLLKNIGRVKT